MPTRKIKASPVKVTGTAPDDQQFESVNEEDFFVLLRFNREVHSFESNPVTIEWPDENGKISRYTPDVLVHYHPDETGAPRPSVLCEVKIDQNPAGDKPRHWLPRNESEERNQMKWAAAERYATMRGWLWKVVRDSEIHTPYLRNAKFLLRHVERPGTDFRKSEVLEALRQGPLPLQKLVAIVSPSVSDKPRVFQTCYRMLGTGEVYADLSVLLSNQTLLALPG